MGGTVQPFRDVSSYSAAAEPRPPSGIRTRCVRPALQRPIQRACGGLSERPARLSGTAPLWRVICASRSSLWDRTLVAGYLSVPLVSLGPHPCGGLSVRPARLSGTAPLWRVICASRSSLWDRTLVAGYLCVPLVSL